ncbi:MAG TPA: hypothetical protein VGO34_07845 [Alphaproteobacteria bacterium]
MILVFVLIAVASLGHAVGRWLKAPAEKESDGQDGYIISAVLGLLALLTGFTFSLAIDRFETRREAVLTEANAIGTAYLRAQLLEEPHRARLSRMLVAYTDNRIALGTARAADTKELLAANDQLITDLWTATVAAFPSIRSYDFSSSFIDAMNLVIDMDSTRKTARLARVPTEVFAALMFYQIVTAGVLGYALSRPRGRLASGFLLSLFVLSLLLIIDINRPNSGGVSESQAPMIALRDSLRAQPPEIFDRFNEAR